jgi:hypothetical protein
MQDEITVIIFDVEGTLAACLGELAKDPRSCRPQCLSGDVAALFRQDGSEMLDILLAGARK